MLKTGSTVISLRCHVVSKDLGALMNSAPALTSVAGQHPAVTRCNIESIFLDRCIYGITTTSTLTMQDTIQDSAATSQRRSHVISSFSDNGVTTIELNRPEKRNALSQDMINALITALQEAERHLGTRAIVLTGSPGGPFSAGADIRELSALDTAQAHARGWLKDLSDAVKGIRKPVIAAVEGYALGGGFELALLVVFPCPFDFFTGIRQVMNPSILCSLYQNRNLPIAGFELNSAISYTPQPIPASAYQRSKSAPSPAWAARND